MNTLTQKKGFSLLVLMDLLDMANMSQKMKSSRHTYFI